MRGRRGMSCDLSGSGGFHCRGMSCDLGGARSDPVTCMCVISMVVCRYYSASQERSRN